MSTFMEHIHRDTDTVPLLPGALTGRSTESDPGPPQLPARPMWKGPRPRDDTVMRPIRVDTGARPATSAAVWPCG
jgi:hypothetical protein